VVKFRKVISVALVASLITLGFSEPAKADSSPVTFSQTFTGSSSPTQAIVDAWNLFRSQLTGTYTQFTFSSSNGSSVTVSDPTKVQLLANALRTTNTVGSSATLVTSQTINGTVWAVGYGCTTATGIVAVEFANVGQCTASSTYALRPAIFNANWGGANGSTVNAPTQTLTLTFGPVIPQLATPAAPIVSVQSATTIGVNETSTTSNASSYLVNVYASNGTTFVESATVASGSITTPTTLSNLSPSTNYKVTVTAIGDNVNYANSAESSQTSVTTLAGASTISLAITAGNNPPKKLGASTITATINTAGTVTFFYNGRPLHCLPLTVVVSGATVTCVWKPIVTGRVTLSASLAPSSGSYSASTSAPLNVAVGNRTISR